MTYRIISVLIVALLVGCQTSYRAKGVIGVFGYQDKKLEDGVHQINYTVSTKTSQQTVLDFWHARATELCAHANYFADTYTTNKEIKTRYYGSKRAINDTDQQSPIRQHNYDDDVDTSYYNHNPRSTQHKPDYSTTNIKKISGVAYCAGKPKNYSHAYLYFKTHRVFSPSQDLTIASGFNRSSSPHMKGV